MTHPGGPPEPQPYPQQPYPQPYEQPVRDPLTQQYQPPVPWATPLPPPATQQRGGTVALIGIGGLLAVIVLVVGGYFVFQKLFVDTPTEVVQAYIDEARKDHPDRDRIAGMLCKSESDKLKRQTDTGASGTAPGRNRILDWHVTGETVSGDTAVVYTSYTITSAGSSGRTTDGQLALDLVKENRAWKICDFQA
ncbi:hypothetical protein ACQP2P_26595 [Dactylosporangium sp. CA-139114]|uniref:Rv0361 family membrane protein n=1 Tax=Dactylosporangium sp. CA-139114 TaxID=3239931 RepID=UPI003D99B6D5